MDKEPKKSRKQDRDIKKEVSKKEKEDNGKKPIKESSGFDPGIDNNDSSSESITIINPSEIGNPTLNSSFPQRASWFGTGRGGNPQIFNQRRTNGIDSARQLFDFSYLFSIIPGFWDWQSIGPRNINGRVKCLKVHPQNPKEVYAGTASGWVWKTEDGGRTWNLFDEAEVLNAALNSSKPHAVSPAIGSIDLRYDDLEGKLEILVATGEGVNTDLTDIYHNFPGTGIYYFDGNNWTALKYPNEFRYLTATKVVFCQTDDFDFYFSGLDGLHGVKLDGLGGGSWSDLGFSDLVVTDLAIDPDNSGIVYACVGESNVDRSGLYKREGLEDFQKVDLIPENVDGNSFDFRWAWTRISLSRELFPVSQTRLALKVGNRLYSVFQKNGETKIIHLLNSSQDPVDVPNRDIYGWCSCIAISPSATGTRFKMLAGTQNLKSYEGYFHTETTTGVWTSGDPSSTQGIHDDQQMVEFAPSDPSIVYLANDGGIYRSNDSGINWKKASNGLIITQFYALGNWKDYGTVLGGGTQDQGSIVTQGGLTWELVDADTDGGYVLFDSIAPQHIFVELQRRNPKRFKSVEAPQEFDIIQALLTDLRTNGPCPPLENPDPINILPSPPWLRVLAQSYRNADDPSGINGDAYFTGDKWVNRLDYGEDGFAWIAISPFLIREGFISAISVSEQNPEIIYVGTGDLAHRSANPSPSKVFYFDKAISTDCIGDWKNITLNTLELNQPVTDIVINPYDDDEIFVSFGWDYDEGSEPEGFIYKRSRIGNTNSFEWINLTPNASRFPRISVNALVLHPRNPNILFAGTDIGVLLVSLDDDPLSWISTGTNMLHPIVTDLRADHRSNAIFAATFGKGVYKLALNDVGKTRVYLRSNALDTGEDLCIPTGQIDPLSNGKRVHYWQSPDIKVITKEKYEELKSFIDPVFTGSDEIDGIEFDQIEDTKIELDTDYYILVQAHNKGKEVATNVNVRLLYGKEGALPINYADFGQNPGNGNWKEVGPVQEIEFLEPYKPKILKWEWNSGLPSLGIFDFFALISEMSDADADKFENDNINPKFLSETERKASFKRLGKNFKQDCIPTNEIKPMDTVSFLDFVKKNQGILYGVFLTLLILWIGKNFLYNPCCENTQVVDNPMFEQVKPGKPQGIVREDDPLVARCPEEQESIIINLNDLTVTCESGRNCFERYDDKIGIISHQADYEPEIQGDLDPAYLGYKLCDGNLPGINCNEPPPLGGGGGGGEDEFSHFPSDSYDFKSGSPIASDILSLTSNDPLLLYNPCPQQSSNFITICVLDFDFDAEKRAYLSDGDCSKDYLDCINDDLPLLCPNSPVDFATWEDGISADKFTVRTMHSDTKGNTSVIYVTLIKTNEDNKVFRIAYNNDAYLKGRVRIQGTPTI